MFALAHTGARSAAGLSAYQASGGIATGDEVARLLREHSAQPISLLARWIVARQVLSFAWHGEIMLPLFQFDGHGLRVHAAMPATITALSPLFDDWELAAWFVEGHCDLGGSTPAQTMACDGVAVLRAAQSRARQGRLGSVDEKFAAASAAALAHARLNWRRDGLLSDI